MGVFKLKNEILVHGDSYACGQYNMPVTTVWYRSKHVNIPIEVVETCNLHHPNAFKRVWAIDNVLTPEARHIVDVAEHFNAEVDRLNFKSRISWRAGKPNQRCTAWHPESDIPLSIHFLYAPYIYGAKFHHSNTWIYVGKDLSLNYVKVARIALSYGSDLPPPLRTPACMGSEEIANNISRLLEHMKKVEESTYDVSKLLIKGMSDLIADSSRSDELIRSVAINKSARKVFDRLLKRVLPRRD